MSNMKFKIGDRVRVVGNGGGNWLPLGTEVVILLVRAKCNDYQCQNKEDGSRWYCLEQDLAPIEEPAATIHEATEPEGKKPSVSEPTLLLKLLTGGDKQFYSRENFHKELCKYQHFHLQDGIYFIRDIMSPSSITVIKVTEQLESIWHENALIQVKIVFDLTLRISEVASIVASMTKDYPNNYQQILGMLTSTIQAIREATERHTTSPEAAREFLQESGIEENNGWIDVKDSLPEDSQKVLFYLLKGKEIRSGIFLYKDQWDRSEIFCDGSFFRKHQVTHWQPLPAPPKTKQ